MQAAKCNHQGGSPHRQGYCQLHAFVILECHYSSLEARCGQDLCLAQLHSQSEGCSGSSDVSEHNSKCSRVRSFPCLCPAPLQREMACLSVKMMWTCGCLWLTPASSHPSSICFLLLPRAPNRHARILNSVLAERGRCRSPILVSKVLYVEQGKPEAGMAQHRMAVVPMLHGLHCAG